MKKLFTAARVRAIISDCITAADIQNALRRHAIPFSYDTTGGALSIRIHTRRGCIRISRTDTRRAPFLVYPVPPVRIQAPSGYHAPVYRND